MRCAYLDEELFDLLQVNSVRLQLSGTLVQCWFPKRDIQLHKIYEVDEFQSVQLALVKQGGAVYNAEDLKDEEKTFVRSAAFRRAIVALYDQRCILCRVKIISRDSQKTALN